MKCDGWIPIPGPAIPYSSAEQTSYHAEQAGDTSFGHESVSHQQIESAQSSVVDVGLHLPISNAVDFHTEGSISSGSGNEVSFTQI